MRSEGFGRHAEQLFFRVVGIDDEAALDDGGRAGNFGEKAGDQAAGAGFRGRDLEACVAAAVEQGGGPGGEVGEGTFAIRKVSVQRTIATNGVAGTADAPLRRRFETLADLGRQFILGEGLREQMNAGLEFGRAR